MAQYGHLFLCVYVHLMEEYRLETPEAITVAYPVAGIGTRMVASLFDLLIWALLDLVVIAGSLALYLAGTTSVAIILYLTLSFLLFWGYFIVFEWLWSGQTPGKRRMHIRVIKYSGYPIGLLDSLIRNVVRIVDFLPSGYGVGVVTMFISTDSRRLGDYAAGTLVVKEHRGGVPAAGAGPPSPLHGANPTTAPLGANDPDELNWRFEQLMPRDLQIMDDFLTRAPKLLPTARTRIGTQIAEHIADRIESRRPYDATAFLTRVLSLYRDEQEP